MPVIIVKSAGSGDGHAHANLDSLNKLEVTGPGSILAQGRAVGESAIEVTYRHAVTAIDLANRGVELPEDCDTDRAVTVLLEDIPQGEGRSWVCLARAWPLRDLISWDLPGSGIAKIARAGDTLAITYYKKL